jgi:hypothetical protein
MSDPLANIFMRIKAGEVIPGWQITDKNGVTELIHTCPVLAEVQQLARVVRDELRKAQEGHHGLL